MGFTELRAWGTLRVLRDVERARRRPSSIHEADGVRIGAEVASAYFTPSRSTTKIRVSPGLMAGVGLWLP